MKNSNERQISNFKCFLKLSLLFFAVLVTSLIFICFISCFGFFNFPATVSILLLSTIFIFALKKNVTVVENPAQDEGSMCSPSSLLAEEVSELKPSSDNELEAATFCNAAEKSEVSEYQVESMDFPSASESSDGFLASENFDLGWMNFDNVGKTITDCSISDDDGGEDDNLIEISFPDSSSSEMNEDSEEKLQTGLAEYFSESVFRQDGLMELLAEFNEVNEEENLIEIDLSVGSIKGSGLEIQG